MLRFSRFILVSGLLAVPFGCGEFVENDITDPGADGKLTDGLAITVMSQNLYLGVDLGTLLSAETSEEFQAAFQQLVASSAFDAAAPQYGPRRLRDIAVQIINAAPHVVGLQELTRYEFTFADGSTAALDFQEVLQGWLDYFYYMGITPYQYDWVVNQLVAAPTLVLPINNGVAVDYYDSDALLVRSDLEVVDDPVLGTFEAFQYFNIFGSVFEYWRGWEAVTVDFDGQEVVFVNTHLEVQQFEDVQVAQAAELIDWMKARGAPVIAVGDFNSAANHDAPADQYSGSYQLFRDADYADIWLREPHSVGGATCCQAGDLTNVESQLDTRLDLVLVDWGSGGFGGQAEMEVVGDEPGDRILFTAVSPFVDGSFPIGLWPSDHAGVLATLWPAPGQVAD